MTAENKTETFLRLARPRRFRISRLREITSLSRVLTRATGETENAGRGGKALVPTSRAIGLRGYVEREGSKIERNVERVKIRTGRTVHLDGWEGRLVLRLYGQVRDSSRHLCRTHAKLGCIVGSTRCGRGEYLYGVVVPGYAGGRRGHRAKALLTPSPCRRRAPHLDEAYIP